MASQRDLKLFKEAADKVPAYAEFLKAHNLTPEAVKTGADFKKLPVTNKKNYLQIYPLEKLVWQGSLNRPLIFCATSGSTGAPYYFPRDEKLSWQYSWLIEDYLSRSRLGKQKPVLVILAFGMGIWIGGIITLRAFEIAIQRLDYPASLLPVGFNKAEVIKAFKQLSPQFDQTILVGYPPFVKDIIDEAGREQINLCQYRVRLLFAAESFSETFRDYLCEKTGADPLLDTLNIYGTADIGAMAYETPIAILVRRLATKDKKLFQAIFGQIDKTPTLAQYNPRFISFEAIDGEIVLTGNSALPLIRYAVGDHGGVISYTRMAQIFRRAGRDLEAEANKAGIASTVRRHPFIYVYERSDLAASVQGIVVYPEYIKEALLLPELAAFLTERFTMVTKTDKKHNQFLEVNVEMQSGVSREVRLKSLTQRTIRQKLIERSSEFAEVSKNIDSRKLIKVILWPYGDPRYFSPGIKQKWVLEQK